MEYVTFVEIENFKGFKDKVRIELKNPSVLIGPNNAGKTTVIQALSLWSRAVCTWYEKKGGKRKKGMERFGVGINRLNILDIPVKESRYYWNGTKVRSGNTPISFSITVGILQDGKEAPLKMLFNSRDQESVYCRPDNAVINDDKLFNVAKNLLFNLLYPMSGIAAGASQATEEYLINEGQIRVQIGQGQTASVLRNLCYQVYSNDKNDWNKLCIIIKSLFGFDLLPPTYEEARSVLSLTYQMQGVDNPLDIAIAGRGMQQTLLILSYLYSHQRSILMIDEPDAHLEILRQKQIFTILKRVSEDTKCQIIIATHSEVILDEAVESNLTFLINGTASDIAKNNDIKNTLKTLGVEHYYKAHTSPHLLIVEGSTDIDMLEALARKLNHPAVKIFEGKLFSYYTRDIDCSSYLPSVLERQATPGENYKSYFYTLKHLVPELKGIALFDCDGSEKKDVPNNNDLGIFYWKRYELENYFITPESLMTYIDSQRDDEQSLFLTVAHENMQKAIDVTLANMLFEGDISKVAGYKQATLDIKNRLLSQCKMSKFAEDVFALFAEYQGEKILLNKGDFYKIIQFLNVNDIPDEVTQKLDLIVQYLGDPDIEK